MIKSLPLCLILALMPMLFNQAAAQSETGLAIYYADYLHGQPTAYGETYLRDEMTAAHRFHPPGTLLQVTRLDNGRSVVVRVNDRGAFCEGCIVDVSKAAALQLDLLKDGKARVSVNVVGRQEPPANPAITSRGVTTISPMVNQHTTYPRPSAGTQNTATYPADQPVGYGQQNMQARTPYPAVTERSVPEGYHYEEALARRNAHLEQYTGGTYKILPSDNSTYERLRARGLLPEKRIPENDASFYERGGVPVSQQTQAQSYGTVNEPQVNTRAAAQPSNYITWEVPSQPTKVYDMTETVQQEGRYAVQLAAYRNQVNAQRQLAAVRQKGISNAYLLEIMHEGAKLYKVLSGPYGNKQMAMNQLSQYKQQLLLDGIVILLQ